LLDFPDQWLIQSVETLTLVEGNSLVAGPNNHELSACLAGRFLSSIQELRTNAVSPTRGARIHVSQIGDLAVSPQRVRDLVDESDEQVRGDLGIDFRDPNLPLGSLNRSLNEVATVGVVTRPSSRCLSGLSEFEVPAHCHEIADVRNVCKTKGHVSHVPPHDMTFQVSQDGVEPDLRDDAFDRAIMLRL
jgi:hypothetical protein